MESRNRVGGRVYTHYFGDQKETESYYDIGAMRFPKVSQRKSVTLDCMLKHQDPSISAHI